MLPIPGATRTWSDTRTEGTITLVIGTWLTSNAAGRSMHVMASFRSGEIGMYCDDIDISLRSSGQHA